MTTWLQPTHVYICTSDESGGEVVGVFDSLHNAIASWRMSYSKVADDVAVESNDSVTYIVSLVVEGRTTDEVGSILRTPLHSKVEHL